MLHRPLWWLTVGPVINGIGIPLFANAEKDAVGAGCWWKDHLLRNDLMKHSVAQLPKLLHSFSVCFMKCVYFLFLLHQLCPRCLPDQTHCCQQSGRKCKKLIVACLR